MFLNSGDVALLSALTRSGNRVIKMSEGIIQDGKLIVSKGPLMAHTNWINKIDRHKRLALLYAETLGSQTKFKVGLEITSKR
jgi:hypothetical protein